MSPAYVGASGTNFNRPGFAPVPGLTLGSLSMVGLGLMSVATGSSLLTPTASNTGPRSATTSTNTGDYTLTTGSIANVHITGDLYLKGANVTATDCLIDGAVHINAYPGGNYNSTPVGGQLLSYCAFSSIDSVGSAGIELDHCKTTGASTTLVQVYGNTIAFSGANFHDCYFAGILSTAAGAHLEAMHVLGSASSCTFNNNVFDASTPDATTFSDVTGSINVEYGSGVTGMTFTNNVFRGGGQYQLYPNSAAATWTGNEFESYTGYPGGTLHTPSVYGSSAFGAGWHAADAVCSGNTKDGVAWDLKAAFNS